MRILKFIPITLFIILSSLSSIAYAETLKFGAATYEGEVKNGKAHGIGIFTFSDGSIYEGKVSKNRIHGLGKYTDSKGNVFNGKFRYGIIKVKIDKKTRDIVKIKPKTGAESYSEMKGKGTLASKWFEAEKNSSGAYQLTAEGEIEMAAAAAGGDNDSSSGSSGGDTGGSSGC